MPTMRLILIQGSSNEGDSSDDPSEADNLVEMPTLMDGVITVEEKPASPEEAATFIEGLRIVPLIEVYHYLGNDLEVLRGRTFLDDGSYHILDLMYPNGVVLVPGQTLPLTVFDPRTVNMLVECIGKDRTFGVICRSVTENRLQDIGTTAEIYEYQYGTGLDGFRIKAKGRQRFKVIKSQSSISGGSALVKILPEVRLPDTLNDIKFQSLNRHRTSQPLRCRKRDAMLTSWPEWVYRQYDTKRLMAKMKDQLLFLEEGGQTQVGVPQDPSELSFWVAYNLPINEEQVKFLLQLNSPIQRLRWELSLLQKVFCCNRCLNHVGSRRDVFSMSVEGPQGTYVNPGGYIHETLTLYKVRFIYATGTPSTEFSWFPGYAWSIAKCQHCYRHMGWKFTATDKKLKPKEFWGLCRGSLFVNIDNFYKSDDDQINLIF